MTHKLINLDGTEIMAGVPCVHCGHALRDHNRTPATGVGWLRCDDCDCYGFSDTQGGAYQVEEPTEGAD